MFITTSTPHTQQLNRHNMITLRHFLSTPLGSIVLLSQLLLGLLFSQSALAEQKETFGDYEVHYSAFASTFLTPEVAKQYDIVRSKAVGVINISVLKKSESGIFEPVAAHVEGVVSNDIQQQKHLGFRRIKEGKAMYFISEVQFMEGEVLSFNISSTPEGQQKPLKMRFSQTFYNDK